MKCWKCRLVNSDGTVCSFAIVSWTSSEEGLDTGKTHIYQLYLQWGGNPQFHPKEARIPHPPIGQSCMNMNDAWFFFFGRGLNYKIGILTSRRLRAGDWWRSCGVSKRKANVLPPMIFSLHWIIGRWSCRVWDSNYLMESIQGKHWNGKFMKDINRRVGRAGHHCEKPRYEWRSISTSGMSYLRIVHRNKDQKKNLMKSALLGGKDLSSPILANSYWSD